MPGDALLRCRVCGALTEEPPYGDDGRSPDFWFCPCCDVEHGYQDCQSSAAAVFRRGWLARGGRWKRPSLDLEKLSLVVQLSRRPEGYRDD